MTIIKNYIFILLLTLLIAGIAAAADIRESMHPGRVLVLAEAGYTPSVTSLLPEIPFSQLKQYDDWRVTRVSDRYRDKSPDGKALGEGFLDNLYILSFPDDVDVLETVKRIEGSPGVRYVEPDYLMELYRMPTDSLFSQQWYLQNTGQEYYAIERIAGNENDTLYLATGTPGKDIRLGPVYEDTPADAVEVVVAIIDTGVDYEHPDLAANVFHNPFEIPGNDIDDDHNGLVDDVVGWDFSGNRVDDFGSVGDSDPADSIGHGTHVAGLVAAVNNDFGIAAYPGAVKVLPIKIFPRAFQSVTAPAILYAVEMGAKVINLSWGSPFEQDILHEAIAYAESRGVLIVAAVGNFGDSRPNIPASFEETFTVGGTNSDGFMTYFSSYGPVLDISAPGRDILSLRAANSDLYAEDGEPGVRIIAEDYIIADGTSMSAPIVAGAAAMLWSFQPGLDVTEVREALEMTADDLTDPWGDGSYLPGYDTLSGWGSLNVAAALAYVRAPSAYISSPQETEVLAGLVTVGLGVTGGYAGPVSLYLGAGKAPSEWTLLHHLPVAATDEQFYLWDSGALAGYYTLRLESDNGDYRIPVRLVNGAGALITQPTEGEELRYLAAVSGSAYGQGYDSATVAYRAEAADTYTQIFHGPEMYFEDYIEDWPVYELPTGEYYLRLQAFCDAAVYTDSILVTIRQMMRPGFPRDHPGYISFSPGTADLDGDGLKEIVVGCSKGVYAYEDDGTLMSGFPVATTYDMRTLPAFADVDGDGLTDIIMAGKELLVCYNYLGQELPGWPRNASSAMTYYTYPVPTATRLYDAGDSVVLYMSRLGEVNAYRYNGDSYFYSLDGLFTALDPNVFDTSNTAGLTAPIVTATDLENDGSIEVVGFYSTAVDKSGIYIWNARNGLPLPGWETPQARNIRRPSGGCLGDIDRDGTLEIIIAGTDENYLNGIWVTKYGRDDVPGWPVMIDAVEGWIGTSPVCADIDLDGYPEIIISYFNWDFAHVYAFNHDGTPCKENPPYLPTGQLLTVQNTLSHIIVGDIDGDGMPNLVARGGHLLPSVKGYELIYAWEPDGTLTDGFPIVTPTPTSSVYSTPNTPVLDDLDGDGNAELLLCSDLSELFVWNLDTPYDADLMMWPKYMIDQRNSGVNPDRGTPTAADDDPAPVPYTFAIDQNYPNPFNPSTTIRFTLDRSADISLEIYNVLGQKVTTLAGGRHVAGEHRIVWDGTNAAGDAVASGVYLARLRQDDRQATRKMVLVR